MWAKNRALRKKKKKKNPDWNVWNVNETKGNYGIPWQIAWKKGAREREGRNEKRNRGRGNLPRFIAWIPLTKHKLLHPFRDLSLLKIRKRGFAVTFTPGIDPVEKYLAYLPTLGSTEDRMYTEL